MFLSVHMEHSELNTRALSPPNSFLAAFHGQVNTLQTHLTKQLKWISPKAFVKHSQADGMQPTI